MFIGTVGSAQARKRITWFTRNVVQRHVNDSVWVNLGVRCDGMRPKDTTCCKRGWRGHILAGTKKQLNAVQPNATRRCGAGHVSAYQNETKTSPMMRHGAKEVMNVA